LVPVTTRTKHFLLWLSLLTVVGLAVRLFYAYHYKWGQAIGGDAFYYHYQANGLIHGDGFQWYRDLHNGHVIPRGASADHPPLAPLYYAAFSLVGLSSFHWHMVASCLLGAGTVFVCGLVGREVVGERTGLIAAAIAAVYANLWVQDPLVTSETITFFMVAVVILLSYRFWRQPSVARALWLGAMCGVAMLTRAEVALFLPLVLLPLAWRVKAWDVRRRIGVILAGCALAALVISPWVIRNMTAFRYPLYLSGGAEITIASASCDTTYYGPLLGWWNPKCVLDRPVPKGDASEQAREWRRRAFAYIRAHEDRLPAVELARLGRVFELYHPGAPWGTPNINQKILYDRIEGRELGAARIALVQYYLLAALAILGAVVLWHRKVTLLPFLATFVIVVSAVLIAFGNTRYRAPLEITFVVLPAVAIDAAITRWWRKPSAPEAEPDPSPDAAHDDTEVAAAFEPAGTPVGPS
jgi:4-amino-4-deoxy-L-arabinose transferase-like glycosyltransferase